MGVITQAAESQASDKPNDAPKTCATCGQPVPAEKIAKDAGFPTTPPNPPTYGSGKKVAPTPAMKVRIPSDTIGTRG